MPVLLACFNCPKAGGRRPTLTRADLVHIAVSQRCAEVQERPEEAVDSTRGGCGCWQSRSLLQRARVSGWPDTVCFKAAEGGHLDVLVWARSYGFPLGG